jgi:hypothetical protein
LYRDVGPIFHARDTRSRQIQGEAEDSFARHFERLRGEFVRGEVVEGVWVLSGRDCNVRCRISPCSDPTTMTTKERKIT